MKVRCGRFLNSRRGFTLIELLLAMAVSAVVALLAYAGISTAIDASQRMQAEVRRLGELQQTLGILEEDLLQVRPRAIINGYGSEEAAFRGGAFEAVLLEFTRGGLANPLGLARSELQRVRYVFSEGALWRQSWVVLDRVDENTAPDAVQLLAGVDAVRVGFLAPGAGGSVPDFYALTSGTAYVDAWSSQRVAPDAVSPLPIAVSVTLTLANFGEVQRVFELP